jgi:hypothetical protein
MSAEKIQQFWLLSYAHTIPHVESVHISEFNLSTLGLTEKSVRKNLVNLRHLLNRKYALY